MSSTVTLTLSDQAYQQATILATRTGRSMVELLTNTIERSLLLLYPQVNLADISASLTDSSVPTGEPNEGEILTEQLYGLVKRTSSYEELDELYHEQ